MQCGLAPTVRVSRRGRRIAWGTCAMTGAAFGGLTTLWVDGWMWTESSEMTSSPTCFARRPRGVSCKGVAPLSNTQRTRSPSSCSLRWNAPVQMDMYNPETGEVFDA